MMRSSWLPHPPCLPALVVLLAVSATPANAQRLPTTIAPEHYDLSFDVDLAHARFGGVETIRVQIAEPTLRILLNAVDITFHEVTIESGGQTQTASVSLSPQVALLTVPRPLAAGPAAIHIKYGGILNDRLRGFYLSTANGRRYAVSQMEATDARRAFPSFDEPAFKATFAISLTIDQGDTAISNGRIIADTPGPGVNRHTVRFSTSPKMSSYLVALAVGDFTCLEGSSADIPIRICATPDKTPLGHLALEAATRIMAFYNAYYDVKYPFGKLDVLAVPDFAAGAMENTAAIFYRETALLADTADASTATRKTIASVLAHEMAHQWFGDLVTMAWWDDLWLNEGFATWMSSRPLAAWKPEWNVAVDEALETQTALDLDSLRATRPIHATVETPGEIDGSFDAIAYEKGAAVLRMVEGFVGPDAFRKGVNAYIAQHAYGNATSRDFWTAMAASSGQPLDTILSTFVSQPGAPLLTASVSCAAGQTHLSLAQRRLTTDRTSSSSRGRWQIPVCARSAGAPDQAAICRIVPPSGLESAAVGAGCMPWVFLNAGANGYYRTSYPTDIVKAIAPQIQTSLTAPERLSLLGDEWAMVKAGRHTVGDFLTLASGFGDETSSGVLGQLAERLATIRTYLTTPETGPRLETFIRQLFEPLARRLGPHTIPGEDPERTLLRAQVLDLIGGAGGDPDTLANARRSVDDALAGRAPLDATAADALVALAARHGDSRLFDGLLAASRAAASPEERYRYLYALTQFADPTLAARGLQLSLTSELRAQDAPQFLGRYLANPATNGLAWPFVKAHWAELEPKLLNFLGDVQVATGLASFCDAASRNDIVAFFRAHRLPTGGRALDQSIEHIDRCIALKAAQAPRLTEWLMR